MLFSSISPPSPEDGAVRLQCILKPIMAAAQVLLTLFFIMSCIFETRTNFWTLTCMQGFLFQRKFCNEYQKFLMRLKEVSFRNLNKFVTIAVTLAKQW